MSVFQRLAHDFQRLAAELRELIKEEHPMMGERNFSWTGIGTAA